MTKTMVFLGCETNQNALTKFGLFVSINGLPLVRKHDQSGLLSWTGHRLVLVIETHRRKQARYAGFQVVFLRFLGRESCGSVDLEIALIELLILRPRIHEA